MASTSTTRTRIKWQKLKETKQQTSMTRPCEHATPSSSSSKEQGIKYVEEESINEEDVCSSGCATPKAKRFRIPEVQTCPPAPKKRRLDASSTLVPKEYEVRFSSVGFGFGLASVWCN
ncbi:hypothetical protein JHK87_053499 [Glycine soja]|nr:hypothetical protein JHK87_053499 [Glycine soja]